MSLRVRLKGAYREVFLLLTVLDTFLRNTRTDEALRGTLELFSIHSCGTLELTTR
jgi:hypothetical protein